MFAQKKRRAVRAPRAVKDSFIHQAWALATERMCTRKALRLLQKQEWSIEFLTAMLIRAANVVHRPLEMTIKNRETSVTIRTTDDVATPYKDDSIFNHLDDELKIRQFISEVNR